MVGRGVGVHLLLDLNRILLVGELSALPAEGVGDIVGNRETVLSQGDLHWEAMGLLVVNIAEYPRTEVSEGSRRAPPGAIDVVDEGRG